jgi:hypothetical protein
MSNTKLIDRVFYPALIPEIDFRAGSVAVLRSKKLYQQKLYI